MTDFVDQFEEIFNPLERMGTPFSEEMQIVILLSSFGDKSKSAYSSVVAAMQTTSDFHRRTSQLVYSSSMKRDSGTRILRVPLCLSEVEINLHRSVRSCQQ